MRYYKTPRKNDKEELVVAICKEDCDWISDVAPSYSKVTVYNKCGNNYNFTGDNIEVIQMKNIGSCDYAYLTYVIDRYDTLPDFVQFTKGSLEPKENIYKTCKQCIENDNLELYKFKLTDYKFSNNPNSDDDMWVSLPYTFGEWLELYGLKEIVDTNNCNLVYGGQFGATKNQLRYIPKSVYEMLRNQQNHKREEVDHFIERLWGALLCLSEHAELGTPRILLVDALIDLDTTISGIEWCVYDTTLQGILQIQSPFDRDDKITILVSENNKNQILEKTRKKYKDIKDDGNQILMRNSNNVNIVVLLYKDIEEPYFDAVIPGKISKTKLKPFDNIKWYDIELKIPKDAKIESVSINPEYKYKLVLVGIFKNEAHIMEEWLEHYKNQGVEYFYLIDNGSTDDWEDKLGNYPVTVIKDDEKHIQPKHYNKYLDTVKKMAEWVVVVDLDEFVYGRNEPLVKAISRYDPNINHIRIKWKMFGSNGHINQPDSVIDNFTFRLEEEGDPEECFANHKSIVKTADLENFGIHDCEMNNDNIISLPDKWGEKNFQEAPIHLNHYAIQSWKWFEAVKMTRGDVGSSGNIGVRNREYFDKYDKNDLYDPELKNIKGYFSGKILNDPSVEKEKVQTPIILEKTRPINIINNRSSNLLLIILMVVVLLLIFALLFLRF